MPMLITVRIGLPLWPSRRWLRTASLKARMRSLASRTSGMTSLPAGNTFSPERSATCSTARSSLLLICSPANMRVRQRSTSACRARSMSSASVASVTRCLE